MKTEPNTLLKDAREPLVAQESPAPHWRTLMHNLEKLGNNRLEKRRKEAQRLLRENGAIHNVFDPPDAPRSWRFDPIPLVFDPAEWDRLRTGLVQRAELLNLILADIHGPRTLIEKGLLPPELVFTHKGFLYPCVGLLPPRKEYLNLYSANLAKGTDGGYWVVSDHPKPPLGAGYALETRIIMTRSFPQLFEDFQVHRLAMYFRALRNSLALLARHNQADPRIVMLTPGPAHPTFFEHAYLASYLGYPLVQGDDLVVRDGCVWLKSVDGLRQVDVILRRLDDEYCDPLELRGDSLIGVPGLLEAVRRGNVAVANPIGSGVLENPALMAFLPAICKYFFNEELKLPSVATWWCGQPKERDYVLANLDRLVIKPIHPLPIPPKMAPGQPTDPQRRQWRDTILAAPHLFVGQEKVDFATFPAFETDRIEARQGLLSVYLTGRDDSYVVMPGGLTRVYAANTNLLLPEPPGACIKDTWVLTPEPDHQVNLWLQAQPDQQLKPLRSPLPSRAAENLFWAGRYAERAEQTSRLLRSILIKLREAGEFHDLDDRMSLHHLLRALTHITLTYPGFVGEDAKQKLAEPRPEILSLVRDVNRPGSLRSSLSGLGHAAYAVRDLLPEDAWRVVDNMQQWNPKIIQSQIGSGRLLESVNQLILQLSAFSGLAYENMSRETAWLLLNIGRRLERALNLIALLRATLVPCYGTSMEAQMMEAVLATCNSLVVFRRRYRSFMQLAPILELLLMDENYPRALAYQLRQLQKHIDALPHDPVQGQPRKDEQLISEAIAALVGTDRTELTQVSMYDATYPQLDELLLSQGQRLEQLSETLMRLYFSPTLVPRQLGNATREETS